MAVDRDALFDAGGNSSADDILSEIDRLLAGIDGAPEAEASEGDSSFDFWEPEETPAAFAASPEKGPENEAGTKEPPEAPAQTSKDAWLSMEAGEQAEKPESSAAETEKPEEPPAPEEEPSLAPIQKDDLFDTQLLDLLGLEAAEGPAAQEAPPALEDTLQAPEPEPPVPEPELPDLTFSDPAPEPASPAGPVPAKKTEEPPDPSTALPDLDFQEPAQPRHTEHTEHPQRPPRRRRKKKYLNRWYLLLAVWLAGFFPELVLHVATSTGPLTLYNSGLLMPLLFAGVPALALFALTLVLPSRKANHVLLTLYPAAVLLLCASQLVYSRIFNNSFYSAYSMLNGGQVFQGQFNATIFTEIWKALPLILLMAVPVLLLIFLAPRVFSFRPMKKPVFALGPIALALALHLIAVAILPAFGTGAQTAYDLYHSSTDPYASVNRLGVVTSLRLDLTRLLTHSQPGGSLHFDPPPTGTSEPSSGSDATSPPASATTAPQSTEPQLNVLDFNFDAMASRIVDEQLRDMYLFFAQRTPSSKNDHTGLFKGCNLILICAEAFDSLAVSQERTPTLYKLMHEGVYFSNYYVSDWGTSTTDGEYAFLTGTVPEAGVWSFERTAKYGNAMPLTMPQQLLKQGYHAFAFHGHDYDYYSRNEYLENLGFTYKAHGQGLEVDYTWPESDVEVIDKSTADYVNQEPFITYYMTISGHREFNFSDNYICYKNRELVEDEPYSSHVQAYLACQLELEKSMELLMQRLEEAGVLENTVIVLTADHYPNGLTDEELSELAGYEISDNFGRFRNGAILYKAGMTPETVDAPCSHLDLLPTLSNLFGLDFDSRLYMGRDVFSDAEPFVMFRDGSWLTNLASYNSNTGEITNFTETPVSDEYAEKMSNELSNRFTVSSWILENDFWGELFGKE